MSRPQGVLKLIPKLIESKILIATFANINPSGIQGVIKIKIIFALYYITLFTWFNDENESLEKTMSVLDKYLHNIEKFVKFWNVLHNILISSKRFFLKFSFSSLTFTLSKNSNTSFLASAKIDNDFS